jgi:hypothetical protein
MEVYMDKSIVLVEQELKEEMVEMLNKYINNIPASMIANILKDAQIQMQQLAEEQLKQAQVEYNKQQEREGNTNGG